MDIRATLAVQRVTADGAWWWRGLTAAERAAAPGPRPSWAEIAEQAIAAAAPPPGDTPPADEPLAPLRPFLAVARERLAAGARTRLPSRHADADALAEACILVLGRQLGQLACRTLASELDIPAGELGTPAGLAALLAGYPVLARLLGTATELAVEAGLELLDRFAADRPAIVGELLGGTDPGRLVTIEPGLGDRHQRGRTVAALCFADGRKVIYKPRSLDAHAAFGEIAGWLSQRAGCPGLLRTPAAVCRAGYGWLEFIDARPLPDLESAARFYRRAGVLLAALYATHTTDMHSENIIASGTAPVPVDVETLFHPALPIVRATCADPAAETLASSVQRAGLLPQVTVGEDGPSDWSGMGGDPAAGNRPRAGGQLAGPAGYEADLLAGFRQGYDAILAARPALIDLIRSFGRVEVRTVVRPTLAYKRLIEESTDPGLLRDADDRDQALGVLREVSASHPLWSRLASAEVAELWTGDIPVLTSRPAEPDIWTSSGSRLPDVLSRSGMDCALDKIAGMSELDRRDQEWIISASLATLRSAGGHRDAEPVPGPVTATAAEADPLIAAACGVADQIVARAITGYDGDTSRVNWLGLQLVEDTQWMVLPMGAGLADGYLGVALFLAQLSELTGVGRYADMAACAVRPVPGLLAAIAGQPELVAAVGCGGIHGLAGISYGLARLARLLGDPGLREHAVTAARLAGVAATAAGDPGWVSGQAGLVAAMLAVHAETGSATAAELAAEGAGRLCELAERTDGRCEPAGTAGRLAPGFAAGPAGIAWALSRFAGSAGDARSLAAARLAASRAVPGDGCSGWCSGAAGVLLARACLASSPDAAARALAGGMGALAGRQVLSDLSLCHGELGVAEVITVLETATGAAATRRARRHQAGLILNVLGRDGSYCGTPGGVSTPGLLSGLAGIGYGLLRLGFAERVPSVLLLEPGPS